MHRESLAKIVELLNDFEKLKPYSVNIVGDEGAEVIHVKDVGRIGWSVGLQKWVMD